MPIKLANNASAHLAAPLNSSDTSVVLAAGEVGNFPSLAAGEWHPMTLVAASGQIEVVKVTARAANVLTVVRGQEGTTGLAFIAGDRAELRATAAVFDSIQAAIDSGDAALSAGLGAIQGNVTTLEAEMATKASQSALDSLTTTVGTKASQADLNALSTTVSGLSTSKANQSDLNSLTTTVGTKVSKAGDTMTGNLTIDPPSGQAYVLLDAPIGQVNAFYGTRGGLARWSAMLGESSAESGSNAGSNFSLSRYSDAGAFIDTPLSIDRKTGVVTANLAMPCAVGHRNGAGAVALGNNVWTKILLGTVASNVGGFTLAGNNLTVPKAGVYQVTAQVNISAPTAIALLVAGFNVNDNTGAAQYQARTQNTVANNYSYSLSVTRLVTLAAGDQLSLMAFCNVAGATAGDSLGVTFLQANLIAAT